MATKRIASAVKDGEYTEIHGEAEDVTELDDSQESELRGVLNDLNADPDAQSVYVKVFKFIDGYDKPYDCFKANVTEVDALTDRIRREFGSGKYRVNVIRNKKLFKIIDLPVLAPLDHSPTQNGQQSETAAILRAMQESQAKQFEQLSKLFMERTGTVQGASDPVSMMTAMMGAMVKMKEFVSPPQQSNGVELFLKGIEVAADMGNNRGESNFADIIRDAMKVIGPAVGETLANRLPANSQQAYAVPIMQQPETAAQPEKNEMNLQQMAVAKFLKQLVDDAKSGFPPGLAAENIIHRLPESVIKEQLLNADTIDKLITINPEIQSVRYWFEELQGHLIEIAIENGWVEPPPGYTPPGEQTGA
jgi:hypothetical protein